METVGIELNMKSNVVQWDFDSESIILEGRQVLQADLLVLADRIKSRTLQIMYGESDKPRETGEATWRYCISPEKFLVDPVLACLIHKPKTSNWSGPDCHVIGYPFEAKSYTTR